MNKLVKTSAISLVAIGIAATTLSASASWGEHREYCKRGHYERFSSRNLNLTAEEAKTLVKARLIIKGNERLKTGQVSAKDDNTYLVEIVTVDGSLVKQVEVNRNSGLPHGSLIKMRH